MLLKIYILVRPVPSITTVIKEVSITWYFPPHYIVSPSSQYTLSHVTSNRLRVNLMLAGVYEKINRMLSFDIRSVFLDTQIFFHLCQIPDSSYCKAQLIGRTCSSGTSCFKRNTLSTAMICSSSFAKNMSRPRRDICRNSRPRSTYFVRIARNCRSAIPTSIGKKPCTWISSYISSITRLP